MDNSVKRTPNRRANRGVIQVYGKPIGPPITKTNPLDDLIKLAQEAKDNGGVVKTPPDQNIVNVVRKSFLDPKDYDRVTLALGRGDRGLGAQILAQQPRLVSLALGKPGQAKIAMDILDKWNAVGGTAPMEVPAQAPVVTPADVPPSVAPPDAIQPEIPASVPPADVPVAGAVPEPAPALPVGLNPAEALPAERKPNLGRVGPLAPEPVQAPMIEQGKLDNKHGAVWPLKPEVGIVEPPKAPSSKPSYSVQLPQPAVNEGARTSKVSTNDSTHWANVKHGWVDLADPAYVKYLTSSEAQRDTGVNSQNREMTRIARTQAHAKRLANFDPQRITTSRTSQEGAAVINTDGVPLTGRDRLLLISEVYALPDSDPRKQNLLSEYASTGADLAGPIPNGMKKPALVRVATDFNGVTPEEFARESDQPTTDVMSDVEKSRADTDAIAGVIKTLYDDDGNITKKGIDTFVKLVGSPGDLIDQDGKPTKAAEKRIERAALMYLMGGKNADVHMVSFVDEHIGNVGLSRQVQGIAQMSGKLSQLSELHPEFSINDDLTKALQVSIQSKSDYLNGLSDNPMGYINQPELGKAIDPNVDRLARMLLLSKSPKEVRDVLQEYIDRVESGGDQTTDMFTGEIPPTTKSQLIEKITHPYSESRMDATPVVEDPELARLHKLVDYHGTTLDPNQAQGIWIDKNGKPVFVNNNIMEDRNRPGKSADWKGERGANDMLSLMKHGFVRLVSGKDFVLIHALSNPGPECDDLLRRAIDGKPTVHVNLGVGNRFTMRNPTFEELRARMGIELGGTRLSYEGGTGKGTGNADYADEFGDRIDAEYEKVKAEEANQYAQTPDLKDAVANIKAKLVPVTDLLQARFVSPSGELLGVHSDEYLKGNGNLSTQSHTDLAGGQKQFDALMRGGWARVKAEGESLYLQTHSPLNVNHFDTIQRIGKGKQQIGVDLSGIYHEFGNLYSRGKVPVDTLVAQLKNANRQVAQPSVMPPSIPLGNKDIVNSHMDTTAGGTGSTTKFDQAIQAAKEHYARTQGTTKEANVGHLHNKPETQPGANGEAVRGMAATETGAKASQPDIEEFVKSSNAYAKEFGFGNIKAYSKNGKAYISVPGGQDAEVVFSSDLGSKADPISMAQALADCGHINNENEYYSMSDGEKNTLHKKLKVHGLFNKSEPNKIWINWESFKEENRPTAIHEALHKAVFHELDRMGGKYFRSSFTPEVEEQWIRHVLDNNIPFPSGVSPPVKKIMDNVVNRMKPDVSSPLNRGKE